MAATVDGIKTSRVSPAFLHGNSTSHTWPFSAVAELIDNAYDPDVNASELWIEKRIINSYDTLTFVDNGNGMSEDKLYKMLSFGYCEKVAVGNLKPIGHYGNGFKSGSMRLGQDALVFTCCAKSMSVGFLSQTYLHAIEADAVVVPIVTWKLPSKTQVDTDGKSAANLEAILKHSLFTTEQQLLEELRLLCKMKTGTTILIYNLRKDKMGNYELDFNSDKHDIRNPETHVIDLTSINRPIHTASPEYRRSLREYCSILYLKPRMKIVLRGEKVKTKLISKSLSQTETDVYRPTWLTRPVKLTFGFSNNTEPESYGLMLYHKNRLIKAYEKIGCQKQANDHGVGVVGVVEANFLEPIHNKQDFNRTDKYSAFMQNASLKLNDYYYQKSQNVNPDQPVPSQSQLPDWTWVQCDNCLSWRRLPTGYCEKLPDKWYCRLNPDAAFNRCDIPEEPEDDDEALQPTYRKTYKKTIEDRKKQTRMEEERRIQQKEAELRRKEMLVHHQLQEISRQNEELQVSSSADRRDRKPTVADLERAKRHLTESQKKMAMQEQYIRNLEVQKQAMEEKSKAMLRMAESLKVSQNTAKQLEDQVEEICGTSSTAVSSSSHLRPPVKRKIDNTNDNSEKATSKQKMDDSCVIDLTDDNIEDNAELKEEEKGDDKSNETEVKAESPGEYQEMTEEKDVKPNKNELDKIISDGIKKMCTSAGCQTVPTVVKLARPEEVDLEKLSELEQKQMLLSKSRELDDTKKSLNSLQRNIWQLLKIIVPDFDYGDPENIEQTILDFIRVNGEQDD